MHPLLQYSAHPEMRSAIEIVTYHAAISGGLDSIILYVSVKKSRQIKDKNEL